MSADPLANVRLRIGGDTAVLSESLLRHELSAAWGDMTGDEFQELVDDVEDNGQRQPIVLYDGRVLDGWHRARACHRLLLPVVARVLPEGEDPIKVVISLNARRRSQTPSQKALAVTRCTEWYSRGRPPEAVNPPTGRISVAGSARRLTTREMAELADVDHRTIERAKVVHRNAVPAVQRAVEVGQIGLHKAAEIAKLPSDEQLAALNKPLAKGLPAPPELATDVSDTVAMEELAAQCAATEHDRPSFEEIVDELQRDNERLIAEIAVAEAKDRVAEALKWHRMYEQAKREQSYAMDRAAQAAKREKSAMDALRNCAKAVGEDNPWNAAAAFRRRLQGVSA